MTGSATPSARELELVEKAYAYALTHGLGEMSLRPLAAAIGSSPRVLLFLFGSKEGLVRRLLARARQDELETLARVAAGDLAEAVRGVWGWLADPAHRPLLRLWVEAYGRSLVDPDGPWGGFAQHTVADWLEVLAAAQPADERDTSRGAARRTFALAGLRGALLDLLATGERERVDGAVDEILRDLTRGGTSP